MYIQMKILMKQQRKKVFMRVLNLKNIMIHYFKIIRHKMREINANLLAKK